MKDKFEEALNNEIGYRRKWLHEYHKKNLKWQQCDDLSVASRVASEISLLEYALAIYEDCQNSEGTKDN